MLRGLCSVCLRRFRLRKDGTLYLHMPPGSCPAPQSPLGAGPALGRGYPGEPPIRIRACGGSWRAPIIDQGYLRIKNGLPPPELAPYGHDDRGNPSTGAGTQPDID